MTNEEKLNRLLSAIDRIENQTDGSIVIHWRASVMHQIPGHSASFAQGYQILKGSQVHLNPDAKYDINPNSIEFDIVTDDAFEQTKPCCE